MSKKARAELLQKVADKLESEIDEFARIESKDQGKPVTLAKNMDITRSILNLRAFAEAWKHSVDSSNTIPGCVNYSTRSPIGVAGIIAPWNLPLYLLTFKLAPALMSGNTVVCKPSGIGVALNFGSAALRSEISLNAKSGNPDLDQIYRNDLGDCLDAHEALSRVWISPWRHQPRLRTRIQNRRGDRSTRGHQDSVARFTMQDFWNVGNRFPFGMVLIFCSQ